MSIILLLLLRIAGIGLILLALMHYPIARRLKWREQGKLMIPENASIFLVHAFFICLVLVMMGLPCIISPGLFLESSRAARWVTWSFAAFWGIRLYFQWFVYQSKLWRGKPLETALHWWFTLVWAGLALLFAACGIYQLF